MNKPNFPISKILGNLIFAGIIGSILATVIIFFLFIFHIVEDSKADLKYIYIVTPIAIFLLKFYRTYNDYQENLNIYNKELSDKINLQKRIENEKQQELIRKEKLELEKKKDIESKQNERNKLKQYIENKIIEIENTFTIDKKNVNLMSNDYAILLNKHEEILTKIENNTNKGYVLQFVKISNYIKEKQKLIQSFYDRLMNLTSQFNKDSNYTIYNIENIKIQQQFLIDSENKLKRQILIYENSIFHSINMLTSLIENKMFVFYEIYEVFDIAGVFDSKWQTSIVNKLDSIDNNLVDISKKMDSLNQKLDEINNSIKELDYNIQKGFDNLTYCFQESISDLGSIVSTELDKINSNLQFNNLLTAVQTRKLYQINNSLKSIN